MRFLQPWEPADAEEVLNLSRAATHGAMLSSKGNSEIEDAMVVEPELVVVVGRVDLSEKLGDVVRLIELRPVKLDLSTRFKRHESQWREISMAR